MDADHHPVGSASETMRRALAEPLLNTTLNATNSTGAAAPTGLQPIYILGMSFALTSLLMSTIALLIQKYSAEKEKGKPCYRRWRFFAGVLLNLLSELTLSPFAIFYAPLALIAPLGGFGMIFNGVLTHFGLICGIRERLSWRGWLGTLIMVAGVTIVAVSAPGESGEEGARVSIDNAVSILLRPGALGILVGVTGLVVLWLLIMKVPSLECLKPRAAEPYAAINAVAASSFGVMSVTMVKFVTNGLAELFGGGAFYPVLLVVLALLIFFAPTQLFMLNEALATSDATFVIPIYLSGMTVIMAIVGGVMFDEFQSMTAEMIALFLGGNAVVFVGLFVLARAQKDGDQGPALTTTHPGGSSPALTPDGSAHGKEEGQHPQMAGATVVAAPQGAAMKVKCVADASSGPRLHSGSGASVIA